MQLFMITYEEILNILCF